MAAASGRIRRSGSPRLRRYPSSRRRRFAPHCRVRCPSSADGRIRFIALKPRELRLCTHRSLSIAAFARWWTMRRYLARTGADFGFFLSLDLLCLPFALGLARCGQTDRRRPVPPLGALPRSRQIPAEFGRTIARLAQGPALSPDAAKSERADGAVARSVLSRARRIALQPRRKGAYLCPTRPSMVPCGSAAQHRPSISCRPAASAFCCLAI